MEGEGKFAWKSGMNMLLNDKYENLRQQQFPPNVWDTVSVKWV